jgi:uncharacterized protein (DUF433 family)
MEWRHSISSDPDVLHGAARFAGTRIPVSVVLDNLADGLSSEALLREYPELTPTHLSAALAYAAELARERVVSVPA